MYKKTFIDDCLNGEATLFNLDEYIEYWHTHDTELTLQDFIGMTDYEFEKWGKSSDIIIRDILRCRKDKIDFSTYLFLSENKHLNRSEFLHENRANALIAKRSKSSIKGVKGKRYHTHKKNIK